MAWNFRQFQGFFFVLLGTTKKPNPQTQEKATKQLPVGRQQILPFIVAL